MTSTRKHGVNDRRHSHLIVRLASHDQNDHDRTAQQMLVLLPVIQPRSLCLLSMQPATSTVQPRSLSLLCLQQKVRHKVCRTLWQDAKYDYFMSYSTLWQALRRRHNFILYVFTPSLVVSRVVALIYI